MGKDTLSVGATAVLHLLHHCSRRLHDDSLKALPASCGRDMKSVRDVVRDHLQTLTETACKARHFAKNAAYCQRNDLPVPADQQQFLDSLQTKQHTLEELVRMANTDPLPNSGVMRITRIVPETAAASSPATLSMLALSIEPEPFVLEAFPVLLTAV